MWALSDGVSPALPIAADKFVDLDRFLIAPLRISKLSRGVLFEIEMARLQRCFTILLSS